MSSTLTDRPSAITLTTTERVALIAHAVRRLDGYENPANLEGDPSGMTAAADELVRAARLTTAGQAGAVPVDLVDDARAGLAEAIEDAEQTVRTLTDYRDRWRAGESACGWPDAPADENERRHAEEIGNAETRAAALSSLAAKLGGAA